jgi:hypothetical protein
MAGLASKLKAAGVYGFAAIGFSQTLWFGVKAMQNHDPSAEVRTKAASTLTSRAARDARVLDATQPLTVCLLWQWRTVRW